MKYLKKYYLLILMVVVAVFFRFYRLDNVPPSPSLDEVSIGYNAYSILKTGKDEYGYFLPILLRAYDDWRPALYVYFVVPFVKLLGLNILAVRMPAAILSVITIFVTYLLAKELFTAKKFILKIGNHTIDPGLLAGTLMAISPLHIYISRLGHEVNLGFSFFIFAVYFFYASIYRKSGNYFLILSGAFFALTFYTYQSFKVITPSFLLILVCLYRREILGKKIVLLLALFIFTLITIPILKASSASEALIRFNGTSAFANSPLYAQTDAKWLEARIRGDQWGSFLNDPHITAVRILVGNYLTHIDTKWIFTGQYNERFKIPGLGLVYIWEAPLILIGLFYLLKSDLDKRLKVLILFWLFSGPIPASLATQAPHAMRSYTSLTALQFLSMLGLAGLMIKVHNYRNWILSVWFIFVTVSTVYLYNQYFKVLPAAQSQAYQYGLNKALPYVLDKSPEYRKIVFSNEKNLSQSYMFYLYWSKFDPAKYQSLGGTKSGGFAQFHLIGKFDFRPIHWKDEQLEKGTLYVGNTDDFLPGSAFLMIFKSLDGTPAIQVAGY